MPSPRCPLILAVFLLALVTGCGKESTTKPTTTGPSSDNLVGSADSLLGAVLFDELNSGRPQRPSDLNFQTPYDYYNQAFQDPNVSVSGRVRARFGLAVLGLLILTSDTQVNSAFDAWKTFLDTRVPFEVTPGPHAPLGIPAGLAPAGEALRLPFDVVPLSLVSLARSPLGAPDPQIAGIQTILRDRALPRLVAAIAHLDAVAADPGFTFIVTPQMQGDLAAEPVEIDRTDILALRAACKLLSASCRVAISYNLSFPAYDEASLLAAVTQGSSWLALAVGGAGQMGLARTDLVGSIDDVDAAIGSLLAESDPQDNDVIRIGPRAFAQTQLDSLRSRLPQVRKAMTTGYTITTDWDSNYLTPDVPLTINPGALLTNPVPDWKAIVPPYTASTEHRPLNTYYVTNNNVSVQLVFTASVTGNVSAYYSFNAYPGGTNEYSYGQPEVVAAYRAAVQARMAAVTNRPDWDGYYYAYGYFDSYVVAGPNNVKALLWYESYTLAGATVAVPVITWDATQFSEWVWPDPQFRGLLPGMMSSDQFLTTFGISPSQWQRTFALDWTVYGTRIGIGRNPPPPPVPALRAGRPLAASRVR